MSAGGQHVRNDRIRATSLKPGLVAHTCTELKSAWADCRLVFQGTRNRPQHLQERLIIEHSSSCSLTTHNCPGFHMQIAIYMVSLVNANFIGAIQVPDLRTWHREEHASFESIDGLASSL